MMTAGVQTSERGGPTPGLRCRVRLADGRTFSGVLPAARHRAIQLGLLHRHTAGLVELTPGTRDKDGRLHVDRRSRVEHYLAGGASGGPGWLKALLEHADRIVAGEYARMSFDEGAREEAFVGVGVRGKARGGKEAVKESRWLWVDIDRPERLEVLWEFLAERPCHLLVETAGSGGVHAYFKLDRPLRAQLVDRDSGELREPIEQANMRIVHALGEEVADPQCRERSRVLRLAGTVNHKSGRYARVIQADMALAPYEPAALVGDLADPPRLEAPTVGVERERRSGEDPLKLIPAPVYFAQLAGITVPARGGLVRCPAHDDEHPSCSVSGMNGHVFKCHACGAGGAIFDLASIVIGGPWGAELRGDAFKRARAYVADVFGGGEQPTRSRRTNDGNHQ
jgi:hypothetical protein